jgi:hypothetical protein
VAYLRRALQQASAAELAELADREGGSGGGGGGGGGGGAGGGGGSAEWGWGWRAAGSCWDPAAAAAEAEARHSVLLSCAEGRVLGTWPSAAALLSLAAQLELQQGGSSSCSTARDICRELRAFAKRLARAGFPRDALLVEAVAGSA